MTTTLTSCSKAEESTQMFADVILLGISGSSSNSVGTFNSEDHSVTSLSSRAQQLRQKLSTALGERHAIYFGFVRKTYGQQQIETLISPKLIQLMDKILEEDVKDPQLRKDARSGVLGAWRQVIVDNPKLADSEEYGSGAWLKDYYKNREYGVAIHIEERYMFTNSIQMAFVPQSYVYLDRYPELKLLLENAN